MKRLLMALCIVALATPVMAHIWSTSTRTYNYSTLNEKLDPMGQRCCGNSDCEELLPAEVRIGGTVVEVFSKRHQAWIKVAEAKVGWMDAFPDDDAAGHWCGYRRKADPTTMQVDPDFHTYCLFLRPPGM